MPVPNVTAGQPITESWGDAVADSVNALEAADAAHSAAADPHPSYATDADLTAHSGAVDPHTGYQKESEKAAANGYAGLDAGGKVPAAQLPAVGSGLTQTINYVIDGGGVAIATGIKGDVVLDFAGTITKWTLLADQSGSITVNVWKGTYAGFPPVAGGLLGSPAIAGAAKAQSGAIAWTFAAGDVLRFNVAAAATLQRVTVALTVTRT